MKLGPLTRAGSNAIENMRSLDRDERPRVP